MSERISLLDALSIWAIRDSGREHGEANFDKFMELAKQSSVPTAFADAIKVVAQTVKRGRPDMDSNELYLQTATRLFEREFTNPTLAGYAVVYGSAMALTRAWLGVNDRLVEMSQRESEIQKYLHRIHPKVTEALDYYPESVTEFLKGTPDCPEHLILAAEKMEVALSAIRECKPEVVPLVENIRRKAVIRCGQVVVIEQLQKNKSVGQRISDRLLGEHVTERDFGRVRTEIKGYFANPMKQTRMTHLAYSGRRRV